MGPESARYPRFRWFILLAICMGFIGLQINQLCLAPMLPEIARDLSVDLGTATHLMAVFLFMSSLSLIGGGFLADRFGIPFMMVLGGLFSAVPAILMPAIGASYPAVLVARLAQGASAGFFFCLMSPVIAHWFPLQEKGRAAGLMGASVSLGSAVGLLAAPAVFLMLKSWQHMAAWLSAVSWFGLMLAIAACVRGRPVPHSHGPHEKAPSDRSAFMRGLSSPFTWVGIAVTFFAAWSFHSLYNLIPSYFAADAPVGAGFGPMMSGRLMLSVMVAGMIGPVIGGLLQDKIFKGDTQPLLLTGFVLFAVFLYCIRFEAVYGKTPVLLVCLVLSGAGIQFVYPFIPVVVSRAYPLHIVGKMLGLWLGIGAFGGAVGIFAGGLSVAKTGSYFLAVTIIALAGIAGLVLTFFLKSRKEIQIYAGSEKVR